MSRLWPVMIRKVHGHSMVPVLLPGTLILGYRWFGGCKPNDVVVLNFDGREIVKRIQYIENGRVFVIGDHADASTDSRHFGMIPESMIAARVIYPRTPKPTV